MNQELFYAASVIKVPIMAAVYRAVDRQELSLIDLIVLRLEKEVCGRVWCPPAFI